MATEIERKFLVAHDGWRASVVREIHIRDGLIVRSGLSKVRVRIADGNATLTLKSHRIGASRSEFEYEIPLSDAEEIMRTLCDDVLEKTRYLVSHTGVPWLVDVYKGILQGTIIAEIELTDEHQTIMLPDWVAQEVTNDPRYEKINMVLSRKGRTKT